MSISIYSPQVRAHARVHGVTELQAYRALKAREALQEQLAQKRRSVGLRSRPGFVQRIFGMGDDWNDY